MASLHPEMVKTQENRKKVEEEETEQQKKLWNRLDQAQADAKRGKTRALDFWDILDGTWIQKLLGETPTPGRLAEGKRQGNKITVKSKDIDGGTTKSKSGVCRRLTPCCRLRAASTFGEGETKNEWFKIQTFDLRGKGGGGGTGAGGGGRGGRGQGGTGAGRGGRGRRGGGAVGGSSDNM